MIFVRPLTVLIAPGWAADEPHLFDLTAHLMRIMFPAEIFMLLGGLFMGALNANKHFLWPGIGPVLYNVLIIIAAAVAPWLWGLPTIAFAVPISALLCNVLLQLRPLQRYRAQWSFLLDPRDEGFKQVLRLAAPVIFGLSIAEVNLLVTAALVTIFDPQWGPVAMEFGNRLWKFPTRFIGAGIAIAVFPFLAEHYAKEDGAAYRRDFSFAIRSTLFLTIPPALVMTLLGDPINRLLFGNLNEQALRATDQALFWYSLGIVPLGLVYILTRSFYARHDTITPVWVGASSIAVCVACAFPLGRAMGVGGLALATSAANYSNAILLAVILQLRVGGLDGRRILASFLRQIVPCTGFALACWYGLHACRHYLGYTGAVAKLAAVFAPMTIATLLFLALAWLFRVEELAGAGNMLGRRFRRR
jgi:putative peptidoglycan lipid II flippase